MQRTVLALVIAAVPAAAHPASAQFTNDPAQPAMLAGAVNDQVQPKVVAIPSGGFYLSWYDNRAGGYDPWVQRFDANGVGAWPDGGVRVLDTSFSSNEDYGLTIDNAGNAVIVTRSDVGGGIKVIAQAVSPGGTLMWGPTGIQLAASGSSPKACRSGDGAAVAGWSEGTPMRAKVMRLNADGTLAWATAATVTDGSATTMLADLQPGDGGSVIASVVRYTTFTGAKTLQAQKYSATGVAQWPAGNVKVFSAGSLQFGNFPPFLPDGEGGAIFAWYTTSPLMSRVQWVSPTGVLKFGPSGAAVAESTVNQRVGPAVTYSPAARRVFASWSEQVPNTSLYGVGMQAFDETGQRLLGPNGSMLVELGPAFQSLQNCAATVNGHPTFTWAISTSATEGEEAWAMSVDTDGAARWEAPVRLCTPEYSDDPVFVAMNAGGPHGVLAWMRGPPDGQADIAGARLNDDGTLGPPAVIGDLDGNGIVNGDDLGILLTNWG